MIEALGFDRKGNNTLTITLSGDDELTVEGSVTDHFLRVWDRGFDDTPVFITRKDGETDAEWLSVLVRRLPGNIPRLIRFEATGLSPVKPRQETPEGLIL